MTQIGTTYAQGLYALAQEESLTDEILSQLDVLEKTVGADQNYLKLLSTPALSKDERRELIDQAFRDKVHIYVLNFMKLLTEKGYIRHFSECCRAYRQLYNEEHGILPVRAVSAVAMSQQQLARLQEKLEQLTGKRVCIENVVDHRVLGGVRLDYDGVRIDGTVKNRLDSVRKLLETTVL